MAFMDEEFLLPSEAARRLYHGHAEGKPILDFHCHLSAAEVAADRRFSDLAELWLAGDHYKWRLMRAEGIPESHITGTAAPREKFLAFARVLPRALRNPIYHWCHLELKRCFGITQVLNEASAPQIWEQANAVIAAPDFSAWGLFKKFNVRMLATTDDPTDSLDQHRQVAAKAAQTQVLPTFRPDRAFGQGQAFAAWSASLAAAAGTDVSTYQGFLAALKQRHDHFGRLGCRASDLGLQSLPTQAADQADTEALYARLRADDIDALGREALHGHLLDQMGRWDAEKGWGRQLHLGARRNNNTALFQALGPDCGGDSVGDAPQAEGLARHLNALNSAGALPRTILYNLNPADNTLLAALMGCYQGGIPGKLQYGSGWWFLDQLDGMRAQVDALSNQGLLGRFVGMVTDSRSFLSYTRHEYFRRLLCSILGEDMEKGLLPMDDKLVGGLVEDICWRNARDYFQFEGLHA